VEAGAADDADPGVDGPDVFGAVATDPGLQPPTASTAAASSGRTWTTVGRRACIPPDTDPGRYRFTPTSTSSRTARLGAHSGASTGTPRRELICARRGRPAESLTRSTARAVWSGSRSGPRRSGSRVSPPNVTNTLTVKSNMHRRDRLERDLLLSPPPRRPWRQPRGRARVLTATGPSAAPRRLPDRPPAAGKRRPTAVLRTGCARHRSRTRAPASRRRRPRPFPAARQRSARQRRPRLQQRHRTREAANAGPNDPDDRVPAHPAGPG